MNRSIPITLPALSSKVIFGSRINTSLPSSISNLVAMFEPTTCSDGMPYTRWE
jgi:hypothetical protein